jgi:hypothetical protein
MVRALLALEMPAYSPMASIPAITAPVMFIGATHDTTCPVELVRAANDAVVNKQGLMFEFNASHFELYRGERLAKATHEAFVFLLKHTYWEGTDSSKCYGEAQPEAAAVGEAAAAAGGGEPHADEL